MNSSKSATILVCTPDVYSKWAKRCIRSVKQFTLTIPYELIVFENGRFGKFSHPYDINRAMDIAQGDYFVTLDDDVEVTPGWLEALVGLADDDVGIVGCVNLNARRAYRNRVRHAGGWTDLEGRVISYTSAVDEPIAVPWVGSACFLINDRELRFDLDYKKYYQEVDLCYQSWLRGKRVMVSPHRIYHYGQGAMESLGYSRDQVTALTQEDLTTFKGKWVENGRLRQLYETLAPQVDVPLADVLAEA
ncbi:MAG: glycosyltransferase [Chloroflexi bacterium]|nr:glycosyltransferase [Chloroflexota bacterium]